MVVPENLTFVEGICVGGCGSGDWLTCITAISL